MKAKSQSDAKLQNPVACVGSRPSWGIVNELELLELFTSEAMQVVRPYQSFDRTWYRGSVREPQAGVGSTVVS